MNHRLFMLVARSYAREARRKRKSYAEMVHQLAQMRADAIMASEGTPEKKSKELQDMQEFLNREYGIEDPTFSMRLYD